MKKRSKKSKAASRPSKSAQSRVKPRKAPSKKGKTTRVSVQKKPRAKKTAARKLSAPKKKPAKKAVAGKKTVLKKAAIKRRPAAKKAAAKRRPASKKTLPPIKKMLSVQRAAMATISAPKASAPERSLALSALSVMASGMPTNSAVQPAVEAMTGFSATCPETRKPRLLWIGDALVPTGFATVTHAVLNHLRHEWDVVVSGVNYDGAAHQLPYQVIPAWQGADMWGLNRFQHLCAEFDPAAVIINNDWWNVAQFARIAPKGLPLIGYMPVDGGNLDPAAMHALKKLHAAVWYTDYGQREAVKAGFKGRRHVIPHGIDTSMFQPVRRDEARRLLDLNVPRKAFIVGNLNRNQPRKRLDLSIQIFADWIRRHRVPNAFLLLHCAQKDTGWDLRRVAAFHGISDRLLLTGGENIRDLQSPRHLHLIYSSLDVQISTTLGEGWGLTTMEGMACGIPQVVPDSSALAEWAAPALKIPCSRLLMNPEINTTGALVDHEPFVAALQRLYTDKGLRKELSEQGIAHVRCIDYDWRNIAEQFHAILAPAAARRSKKMKLQA
jgi:glycosyltransferase involved in cell wall biosynthesis